MVGYPDAGLFQCDAAGIPEKFEIAVTVHIDPESRLGETGDCGYAQKDGMPGLPDEREGFAERFQNVCAIRCLRVKRHVEFARVRHDRETPQPGSCGGGNGSGQKGQRVCSGE